MIVAKNIRVGDYVCTRDYVTDVWFHVEEVFDRSNYVRLAKLGLIPSYKITRHKKRTDPWLYRECRCVAIGNMYFGSRDSFPLPQEVQYAGTYCLRPWLYSYRGRPAVSSCRIPFSRFVKTANVPIMGISADDIAEVLATVRLVTIEGWQAIPEKTPEQ